MAQARSSIAALMLTALTLAGCADLPEGGVARGEVLYQNCSQCHGDAGEGKDLMAAPVIAGLPAWYVEAQLVKYQTGIRGAQADDVEGLKMRPMSRTLKSEADTKVVAEYVASLKASKPAPTLTGGDAEKGKAAFATCSACHGADGAGNEALKSPPVRQLQDWYVVKQLGKFKSHVRAYDPSDATGLQMRGIAEGIADEAAMKDLAAYIQTLPL